MPQCTKLIHVLDRGEMYPQVNSFDNSKRNENSWDGIILAASFETGQ